MPDSIIPYPGGKSKVAKEILRLVPRHELWAEVFAGASWVTLAKDPSISTLEVINDKYVWLINFWRVMKLCPEKFLAYANMEVRSRILFEKYKVWHSMPAPHSQWMNTPDPEAAWAFWYLIRNSFTGSMSYPRWKYRKAGLPESRTVHLANVIARFPDIMAVYDRLQDVDIECLDFRDFIARYDNPTAFFYLDPPYWTPRSGPADYAETFSPQDHFALLTLLENIQGKFLLNYEDSEEVRDAYDWANIKEMEFSYTVPHAGSAGESKVGKELIITNFDTVDHIRNYWVGGLQSTDSVL